MRLCLFGQKEQDTVRAVPLSALDNVPPYVRLPFIVCAGLTVVFGIAELALQNCRLKVWLKCRTPVSFFLGISAVILFMVSPQPYAAVFVFALLVLKGSLLIKRR